MRIALSVPRESTPADWQRSTLAGVYAVLAFYFLVIKPDGPWLASTAFLAIASGAAWYLGVRGEPLFESRPRISRAIQWLTGLPPLYLQVGQYDTVREGALTLATRAARAGVAVTLESWPGLIHGWHGLVNAGVPEALAAWAGIRRYVSGQLGEA